MCKVQYVRTYFFGLCLSALLLCGVSPGVTAPAPDAVTILESTQAAFRQIHDQVAPAVVSINSRVAVEEEFNPLDFFFGTPRSGTQYRNTSGSGVIIRPEGIVLTNSHVVQNATKVTVQLAGSDKNLPAEVVQTDPRSDLAIVRITEKGAYPVAKLGDAKSVKVGDWAIAFGSPYKLPSTMTIGVISATGRQIEGPVGDYTYRDLLQTDASINPGNSGGPLVNIRGEIIGINFMIFSPGDSTGSVGIGFAIPINTQTKDVIDTLAAGRTVERGRLGIYVKNLDDAMREAFGVKEGGVFVDSIIPGQAADKAGIKAEDVITAINETPVTDQDQFVELIERTQPGSTLTLTVVRDKKERKITVTVGAAATAVAASLDEKKVGLSVTSLTPDIAQRLGVATTTGVVITNIAPGSPAAEIGLRPRDIVVRVGATEVKSAEDFWAALSETMAASKHGVLLRIQRGDRSTTVTLPPVSPDNK